MTRDDIIRMAREAGGYTTEHYPDEWLLDIDDIERFAALVSAAEREACAKVCERFADEAMQQKDFHSVFAAEQCYAEIVARGQ